MPLQLTEEETKEHVQGGGKVCATCDTFLPAIGQLFMSRWLFFALKWLHAWRQGRKQDVAVFRSSVQRHTHLWHFCAATDQTLYKFHCILKKITRGGKLQNRNASSLYLSKCFHVFVLYSGIYSYFDSLNLNTNISSFYSLHLHKLECIWGELYIYFLICFVVPVLPNITRLIFTHQCISRPADVVWRNSEKDATRQKQTGTLEHGSTRLKSPVDHIPTSCRQDSPSVLFIWSVTLYVTDIMFHFTNTLETNVT